jgi:hypothetical protein
MEGPPGGRQEGRGGRPIEALAHSEFYGY